MGARSWSTEIGEGRYENLGNKAGPGRLEAEAKDINIIAGRWGKKGHD